MPIWERLIHVARANVNALAIRARAAEIRSDPATVDTTLRAGADKARAVAKETMREVKDRMGFAP